MSIPNMEWDPSEICRCELDLGDMEEQCYKDDVMYVLQTPEESGTGLGYATRTVHAKCEKPVWPTVDEFRVLQIPSKKVFFNQRTCRDIRVG